MNEAARAAHIWESSECPGDLNGDCYVNNFDVDPFVEALTDIASYAESYPALELSAVYHGDVDLDGFFTNLDIDAFLIELMSPTCTGAECCGMDPERGLSAGQAADILIDNVAPGRLAAVRRIAVETVLNHARGDRREFWADVAALLDAQ